MVAAEQVFGEDFGFAFQLKQDLAEMRPRPCFHFTSGKTRDGNCDYRLEFFCRFVVWRVLLQHADKMLSGFGNRGFAAQHDFPGCDLAAINVGAGVIIGAKRGTFEGDAGKQTAGAGVAQDFRSQCRHRCPRKRRGPWGRPRRKYRRRV